MDKLNLLYDALEKLNEIKGIKCRVNFQIYYNSIEVSREIPVTLDFFSGKSGNLKLNSKKIDYALGVIDILSKVDVSQERSGYNLILDIKNLNDLKQGTCDIIKENIEDNKNNKGFKLPHLPKGISSIDLFKIGSDLKKLGVEMEEMEVRSVKLKADFDRNMNLSKIKLDSSSKNAINHKILKLTIEANI